MLVLFRAGYGERELTIMSDGWVRSSGAQITSNPYWGYVPLISVHPGQTVLRAWWNTGISLVNPNSTEYPAGASYLRAGVAWVSESDATANAPTPVTNADADWMAITSINPRSVQFSNAATTVPWFSLYGFDIDLSIKSQRKNQTSEVYFLWFAWEFGLSGESSDWNGFEWWASMDAYVRTPDA